MSPIAMSQCVVSQPASHRTQHVGSRTAAAERRPMATPLGVAGARTQEIAISLPEGYIDRIFMLLFGGRRPEQGSTVTSHDSESISVLS